MPILCLSQSFVTIAPIHHLLEEVGGIHRGGDQEPEYRPEGELCALGDVRHHDSHQSCCLCP